MHPRRTRLACAITSLALVLIAAPAFADPPESSSDEFTPTSTPVSPGTPVNNCVTTGTTTGSGFVGGTGTFKGSVFSATSTVTTNQCSETTAFSATLDVYRGYEHMRFTVNGVGVGAPPNTTFTGNFQACNLGAAFSFPQFGGGSISGTAFLGPAIFEGKYHWTHGPPCP